MTIPRATSAPAAASGPLFLKLEAGVNSLTTQKKITFVVEIATRGSNAREHHMARQRRVEKERAATATAFLIAVREQGTDGLLKESTVLRLPRGLKKKDRAILKKMNLDGKRSEIVYLPLLPLTVKLTRISSGTLDPFDNLPVACKGIADELARQMGTDDRDPLVNYEAAQEKPPPLPKGQKRPKGYGAVRVEIAARGGA